MEEKILEIIGEYVPEKDKKSYCLLANDITSHVMKFIDWRDRCIDWDYRLEPINIQFEYWFNEVNK